MKPFLALLLVGSVVFTSLHFIPIDTNRPPSKNIARCYGYNSCNACSNCSACKHCSAGGTCGICVKPVVKKASPAQQPATAEKCAAITKKGSRCSRNATNGKYCWQHP